MIAWFFNQRKLPLPNPEVTKQEREDAVIKTRTIEEHVERLLHGRPEFYSQRGYLQQLFFHDVAMHNEVKRRVDAEQATWQAARDAATFRARTHHEHLAYLATTLRIDDGDERSRRVALYLQQLREIDTPAARAVLDEYNLGLAQRRKAQAAQAAQAEQAAQPPPPPVAPGPPRRYVQLRKQPPAEDSHGQD